MTYLILLFLMGAAFIVWSVAGKLNFKQLFFHILGLTFLLNVIYIIWFIPGGVSLVYIVYFIGIVIISFIGTLIARFAVNNSMPANGFISIFTIAYLVMHYLLYLVFH